MSELVATIKHEFLEMLPPTIYLFRRASYCRNYSPADDDLGKRQDPPGS
jgi:hypothetical protein